MPPAVVRWQIHGQGSVQRIYQAGLVGGGQQQEISRPLERVLPLTLPIFPPALGN